MMASAPVGRLEVINWATPEPLSGSLPRSVVPTIKSTDPVGTIVLPAGPVTVAVKVTGAPTLIDCEDAPSVVAEVAAITCVVASAEVFGASILSAPSVAME